MEQMIRAGTWVASNTFISYYLKDGIESPEFYSGEFISYGTTGYCGNYYSVLVEPSIGKNFPPPNSRFFQILVVSNCAIEF